MSEPCVLAEWREGGQHKQSRVTFAYLSDGEDPGFMCLTP